MRGFIVGMGLLHLFAFSIHGQSDWMQPGTSSGFYIDATKPFYKYDQNIGFLTTLWTVTPQYEFSEGRAIRIEVPISVFRATGSFSSSSETAVANVYIGVRSMLDEKTMMDFGIRIPTMPDDKFYAQFNGAFSDFDRQYAYISDVASVGAMFQRFATTKDGLLYGLRGGPVVTFITRSDVNDRFDAWVHYGGYAGLSRDQFTVTIGFRGMALLTEDGAFKDRHFSHLEAGAYIKMEKIKPGLVFKIPVDTEISDRVKNTLSLNVLIDF